MKFRATICPRGYFAEDTFSKVVKANSKDEVVAYFRECGYKGFALIEVREIEERPIETFSEEYIREMSKGG